jgi:hypothetical protein
MKQKLFTAFFAFLIITGISKAQTASGTITGTISVPHSVNNIESAASTISITNAGAYQAVLTISYNNTSGLTATTNNIYLKVNSVVFSASAPSITLPAGTGSFKVAVALVIANAGNNSFIYSVASNIASPSTGSVTYGPVTVDLFNDATAAATQALVTQQTADIAALTTAVNTLTTTATTQSADIASLKTSLASLSSQLAGINTNSSASQLTQLQASINALSKKISRQGSPLTNPWFGASFGLQGFSAISSGIGVGMQGSESFKDSTSNPSLKNVPKWSRPGYGEE